MSENTLCNAIQTLKLPHPLTPYQQKQYNKYFSTFKIGDYIYPGHLKSKLGIDMITAYKIMEALKKQGFVRNIYEIYCRECHKSKGIFIESLTDFQEDWHCDFCNHSLSIDHDIIVLYKVIAI